MREGLELHNAYHTRIDVGGTNEVVPALLRVIASVDETAPTELPILYDSIDPDGLEKVLASSHAPLSITFQYHRYCVTVANDGAVTLQNLKPHQ